MDDPYITMEEYIRLEEEKAQRHGLTFNWQTTTFGKVKNYEDEDDCFADFKTEFPAIVFDNLITSDTALPYEPMVSSTNENKIDFKISLDETDDEDYTIIFDENSFSYKIISVNDLKMDSESDKILMPSSSEPMVDYLDDLDYFNDFDNEFPAIFYNDGLTSKPDLEIKPPIWHLYLLHIRDTLGSDTRLRDMMRDLAVMLRMVYTRGDGQQLGGVRRRMTWRQFILTLGLHSEQEMAEAGFGAYWTGPAPSYVLIRDPVRRLCHRMIAYSISGRRQAPEKVIGVGLFYLRNMDQGTANVLHLLAQYLFRHAKGRKSRARLLRAWEAQHLFEVQRYMGLGSSRTREAPSPPSPTPQPRTMSQRIKRIEEEMRDLRHDVVGLREVVESFTIEQSRVST
ncbi:hypothetical protein Tco_0793553 [Tanacetum coccineum]